MVLVHLADLWMLTVLLCVSFSVPPYGAIMLFRYVKLCLVQFLISDLNLSSRFHIKGHCLCSLLTYTQANVYELSLFVNEMKYRFHMFPVVTCCFSYKWEVHQMTKATDTCRYYNLASEIIFIGSCKTMLYYIKQREI